MAATSKPSVRITLPSDHELKMTRVFDAPRSMVFDALTSAALLRRWFGPPPETGWSIAACDSDATVGGCWRIVIRRNSGAEIVLHGVYRELVRPERIVATQLMEGCDGQGSHEATATTLLVEAGGRTTYTNTVRYPSKEVRDRVLAAGGTTEEGMSLVYDKLAALLASMS